MNCKVTSVNMCKTALLSPLGSCLKISLCVCNFCQDLMRICHWHVDAAVYLTNRYFLVGSYLPVRACCLLLRPGQQFQPVELFTQQKSSKCWVSRA